jgi:hypothetical protein
MKGFIFATSLWAWLCNLPHLDVSGPFGSPVSFFFQAGRTASLIAVLNGHLAMAKFLVKKGANKKAKGEVGTVNTLLSLMALPL